MNIITGAGISGATVARVLAERGENVLVIERRPYTGGNCAAPRNPNCICLPTTCTKSSSFPTP